MAKLSALILAVAVTATAFVAHADARSIGVAWCSNDDRGQIWPATARAGTTKTMVPVGATTLIVCRYNGMNALAGVPQFGLRAAGVTHHHATIAEITGELNSLKPTHGAYNCTMDDGSEDVAVFAYPSGPRVVVTVGTGGCNLISNGHVRRMGLGKPVVAQISGTAKPVTNITWATVVGNIQLCGGPAPGLCRTSGSMVDRIVVDNMRNLWVAMVPVSAGRFRLTIASPGTYIFKAMGTGDQINTAIAQTKATVRAGATTNVVLTVAVP